jgi:hypothetical protein
MTTAAPPGSRQAHREASERDQRARRFLLRLSLANWGIAVVAWTISAFLGITSPASIIVYSVLFVIGLVAVVVALSTYLLEKFAHTPEHLALVDADDAADAAAAEADTGGADGAAADVAAPDVAAAAPSDVGAPAPRDDVPARSEPARSEPARSEPAGTAPIKDGGPEGDAATGGPGSGDASKGGPGPKDDAAKGDAPAAPAG